MKKADPLSPSDAQASIKQLKGWSLTPDGKGIEKEYSLTGFTPAADFIRSIGPLADSMDHHPDIHLTRYRRVRVFLTSHFAGGLTKNDFELAAQIEALPREEKP